MLDRCRKAAKREGIGAVLPFFIIALVMQSHWTDRLMTSAICDDFELNLTRCHELLKEESPEDYNNSSKEVVEETNNVGEELRANLLDWQFYLSMSTCCPAVVSALIMGFWSDRIGSRRQPLLLSCCVLTVTLLASLLCTFHSDSWVTPKWAIVLISAVTNFVASPTVFLQLGFASVADLTIGDPHKRLEEFVSLLALSATSKAIGGILGGIPDATDPNNRQLSFIFALGIANIIAAIYKCYKQIKPVDDELPQHHEYSNNKGSTTTFVSFLLQLSVWLSCAAAFFFCFVGESQETVELVVESEEMSDVRSSLYRVYGRANQQLYGGNVAGGLSAALFWGLMKIKRVLHSRVVDDRMLKFLTAPIIGAIGVIAEICVKIILSCTVADWTFYIVMIVSVFSELAICSTRFLVCSLAGQRHYGLALGLIAALEAGVPYISSMCSYYIIEATVLWDERFVFTIHLAILIVPLAIFSVWHWGTDDSQNHSTSG